MKVRKLLKFLIGQMLDVRDPEKFLDMDVEFMFEMEKLVNFKFEEVQIQVPVLDHAVSSDSVILIGPELD